MRSSSKEIRKANLYKKISQALAALDTNRAVGVKGDEREFGYMILLRAVTTTDFMTADWYRLSLISSLMFPTASSASLWRHPCIV